MWNRGLELLVGKTIERAYIGMDKTLLVFDLAGGERMRFYTEGDCCSKSWIEHMSNVDSLAGGKVTEATDIEMGDVTDSYEKGEAPDDQVLSYGVELTIEGRPPFKLEYRNASNGYYGGSIEVLKESKWNREYFEAPLTELKEDF